MVAGEETKSLKVDVPVNAAHIVRRDLRDVIIDNPDITDYTKDVLFELWKELGH